MVYRFLSFMFVLFIGTLNCIGQNFSCKQIAADIEKWNIIQVPNNSRWALAIKEAGLYKQNEDGSFEYTYIIESKDSVQIESLRNIGFDYICYYFNMDNNARADMVRNSSENAIFFSGKLLGIGNYSGFATDNRINADIIFDIRFKVNRIRFSVKVQDYHVIKVFDGTVVENRKVYVKDCYPLNLESEHKKSYAQAFINSNSKCLNYAHYFLEYLNKHIQSAEKKITEDW